MKTRKGYKTYPLTVAQKFHFYYQDFCPKKEVLNIATSLTIQIDIDWDRLRGAIYQACDRCECTRVRFVHDKKEDTWYQYIVEKEDREIEFVDFTGQTMEEAEATMKSWARVPFPRDESPMFKITLIKTPDGFCGVFFLVDHMIMDAQSLIAFLTDVITIYCHETYENVDMPGPMPSYIEQIKRDLEYENGSKAQKRDREYFYGLIEESEPIFNGIGGPELLKAQRKLHKNPKLRAAINVSDSVDSGLVTFHLEAEPTERLMRFCDGNHVSLATLIMTGLRTYFQKFNDNDDVSINTAVARRATLKEKKSGGTRIHSFPIRTIIPRDTAFGDALKILTDKYNELYRHANFDPVEYFHHRFATYPNVPRGATYEPMSFTYQPLTRADRGIEKAEGVAYKTKWYENGATTQAMYLTVMHRIDDNGLDFSFEHQVKAVTPEELEKLYYYLCRIIFRGVENPDFTIGEIIDYV